MLNVFWEDTTKEKLKYEKGGYEDTELFTGNKGLCSNYQEGGPKTRGGGLHKIAAKIGGLKVKSLI